jgi:hypothetical protein
VHTVKDGDEPLDPDNELVTPKVDASYLEKKLLVSGLTSERKYVAKFKPNNVRESLLAPETPLRSAYRRRNRTRSTSRSRK